MAITQRAGVGYNRVWARTYGGWLVSKKPDVSDSGWYYNDSGVDAGPAGLSYTDGSTQRQRVYYSRYGAMYELNYDGDAWHGRTTLPSPPAGTSFAGKAVAAVDWDDAGTRRTAVAAITTAGAVCVWEGTFSGGYASPKCSGNSTASTWNSDIQASVVASGPAFFYRRADYRLGSTARASNYYLGYYWSSQSVALPSGNTSILESIAVTPSLMWPGRFEVIVGGSDGKPHVARLDALANSVSWYLLPTMPSGGDVAPGPNGLSSVNYSYVDIFAGTQRLTTLFVKGTNGALYRITTANGGAWTLGWKNGSAGSAAKPTHQRWLGNGVAAAEGGTFWREPVLWGTAGALPSVAYTGTLQKFSESGQFDDYLYYWHQQQQVIGRQSTGGTLPANEGSASISGIYGLASAIHRNAPAPWQVAVVDTGVAGANWSKDFTVAIANGWSNPSVISASDPYTAVDQDSGLMHLLTLEAQVTTTSETSCSMQNPQMQRMVYRRGGSASTIANMTSGSDLWVVHTGYADHGNLVLTSDASGTSAHVILNQQGGTNSGPYLWTLSPSGSTNEVHLTNMPQSPTGLFADAAGDLYAWTFAYMAGGGNTGFPKICRIDVTTGDCSADNKFMAPTSAPTPTAPLVYFSRGGAHPYACGGGMVGESCFQTAEPFAFAADARTSNKLYSVYQGVDAGTGNPTSVYFTVHESGDAIDTWSTPIRVNTRASGDTTSLYVDPEVTVDEQGTIVITYTRVSQHMSGSTWARSFVAMSTNGGQTFQEYQLADSWRPWDLPFHCLRNKHFLGEYEHPDVLGGRAFHSFHVSTSGNTILGGLLSSRWAVRY